MDRPLLVPLRACRLYDGTWRTVEGKGESGWNQTRGPYRILPVRAWSYKMCDIKLGLVVTIGPMCHEEQSQTRFRPRASDNEVNDD